MTNLGRRSVCALALGALVGLSAGTVGFADSAKAWEPQKPVELIIMAGQGGGADQIARLIQSIIAKNELAPVPFIPINKPGGSGAEALRYLKDKAGDDHVVMITLNSFFTTPLLNPSLGVDVTEFTPIARLALDKFVLWVNAESDIKSLDEFVNGVKEKGTEWRMGGTGTGQEDSLVTGMLETEFGFKVTYVPFEGGGTVAKNLIGNHIDSTVNNPAEQMGFYEAGQSRPLVAFADERLEQFPDVPTAAELGHPNLVYFMQRSFNGPPGMSKEAQDYYIELFRKVNDSQEWIDYTKSDGLERGFISGDELGEYFKVEIAKHEKLLKGMGLL